jgi:hypothetical protein
MADPDLDPILPIIVGFDQVWRILHRIPSLMHHTNIKTSSALHQLCSMYQGGAIGCEYAAQAAEHRLACEAISACSLPTSAFFSLFFSHDPLSNLLRLSTLSLSYVH